MKNIERAVGVFGVAAAEIESLAESGLAPATEPRPAGEAASGVALPGGQLALPALPSIAVLPFANMSGDPDQEFFADGLAEDILTGLSRFRELFVISRNSTFRYKGK